MCTICKMADTAKPVEVTCGVDCGCPTGHCAADTSVPPWQPSPKAPAFKRKLGRDRGAAHVKAWKAQQRKARAKARAKRAGKRKVAATVPAVITHEAYLSALAAVLASSDALTDQDRAAIASARVTYGWGERGTRGIAVKGYWQNAKGDRGHLVGLNCGWQRSTLELVETLAHELGHVIDNLEHGHGAEWKAACARLGFPGARAVDTKGDGSLSWEWFTPEMAAALQAVPMPNDGSPLDPSKRPIDPTTGKPAPVWSTDGPSAIPDKPRPCGAGWGRQGGKSRGKGSGTRNHLWECSCAKPFKIRCARMDLEATCGACGHAFELVADKVNAASTWGTGQRPDGDGGARPSHGGHRVKGAGPCDVNEPLPRPASVPSVPAPASGDIPF